MTNILATLDGSDLSEAVLPAVLALVDRSRGNGSDSGSVTLLTVIDESSGDSYFSDRVDVSPMAEPDALRTGAHGVTPPPGPRPAEGRSRVADQMTDEALNYLDTKAALFSAAGIKVHTQVVLDKDPAEAIIDLAAKGNFDAIAMSTHGRSGLREVLQGSVANAVIKSGVAPVLVLRPPS